MPKFGPEEFYRVTLYSPLKEVERIFRGKSGRKRALEWAGREKKKNFSIHSYRLEACIPVWEPVYEWGRSEDMPL